MDGTTTRSTAALAAIAGAGDAQRLLIALRGGPVPADALHQAFVQVQATGDTERQRAFARELQKRLERVEA